MARLYICGASYLKIDGDSYSFGFVGDLPADVVENEPQELDGPSHYGSFVLDRDTIHATAFRVSRTNSSSKSLSQFNPSSPFA
jgi:hypothetical protein